VPSALVPEGLYLRLDSYNTTTITVEVASVAGCGPYDVPLHFRHSPLEAEVGPRFNGSTDLCLHEAGLFLFGLFLFGLFLSGLFLFGF
jgi:hypothetical protein